MYKIQVMISGDVQGVWFRVSAQDKANELGLTGWVKNLFSNAVEIVAEGPPRSVSGQTLGQQCVQPPQRYRLYFFSRTSGSSLTLAR